MLVQKVCGQTACTAGTGHNYTFERVSGIAHSRIAGQRATHRRVVELKVAEQPLLEERHQVRHNLIVARRCAA